MKDTKPQPGPGMKRAKIVATIIVGLCLTVVLGAWVDPTTGQPHASRVLRPFDPPAQKWFSGHRGVDLALEVGQPVLAAGDGEVIFAGVVASTPVVSIEHSGFRTTYQPVHAWVSAGDTVTEGDVIGMLGHSVDGYPGLHWGARRGEDDYFNPLTLLRPTIRLKPVEGL